MLVSTKNVAKVDLKDRKILFELSRNCRMPTTQIAKRVGLSQQVVDYRIRRLVQEGVVSAFITELDLGKLGFGRHVTYLQFKKVDESKEEEIIRYLVKHPFITWLVTSAGKWSVIFDIVAKNVAHAGEIIDGLRESYGEFLGDYSVATQIDYQYFHSKYYGVKEEEGNRKPAETPGSHALDATDVELLAALAGNARTDFVALAERVGLTPNGARNRVKKLVEAGIVKAFTVAPNMERLGFEQYNVQFTFEVQNKKQERRLLNYIRGHPSINFYYRPIGRWDLEIGVFTRNQGELRKVILDMRNRFSDLIKIFDTALFYTEPKSNVVPAGVFRELKGSK